MGLMVRPRAGAGVQCPVRYPLKALISLRIWGGIWYVYAPAWRAGSPPMDTFFGPPRPSDQPPSSPEGGLLRHLCQVTGLNQNYTSRVGTPYHVQIEDRGP